MWVSRSALILIEVVGGCANIMMHLKHILCVTYGWGLDSCTITFVPDPSLELLLSSSGNDLEGKKTAVPIRKPHGAAVVPVHNIVNNKQPDQEEKDVQMEVFV